MAGVRPIRRYNSALCLVEPRAIVVLSFRAATPYRVHAMPRRATALYYAPLCVPDLPQSRTFGLDSSRPKSGGGHTSVIHTRPRRCDRLLSPIARVALHRPPRRDALRSRDKYPRENEVSRPVVGRPREP